MDTILHQTYSFSFYFVNYVYNFFCRFFLKTVECGFWYIIKNLTLKFGLPLIFYLSVLYQCFTFFLCWICGSVAVSFWLSASCCNNYENIFLILWKQTLNSLSYCTIFLGLQYLFILICWYWKKKWTIFSNKYPPYTGMHARTHFDIFYKRVSPWTYSE